VQVIDFIRVLSLYNFQELAHNILMMNNKVNI